jgi:hypothetical protein
MTYTAIVGATNTYYSNRYNILPYSENDSVLLPMQSATAIINLGIVANGYFNTFDIQQRAPQAGLMQTPDSMAQTNAAGTNLTCNAAFYYPFTSSVQQNVVVPVPMNTTAMQTDTAGNSTSWDYQWSSFTVSFTSATSYTSLSGTNTLTLWDSSSSTAALSLAGSASDEYWQEYNHNGNDNFVFGGFAPVSSASEMAAMIGGFAGTSYDETGGSTTYLTIRTTQEESSLQGTVMVEFSLSVFVTDTTAGDSLPVVSFGR